MLRKSVLRLLLVASTTVLGLSVPALANSRSDAFLQGYAVAELKLQFGISHAKVRADHGKIHVILPAGTSKTRRRAVEKALLAIPGALDASVVVRSTRAVNSDSIPATANGNGVGASVPAAGGLSGAAGVLGFGPPTATPKWLKPYAAEPATFHGSMYRLPNGFFPRGNLFSPLMADPKWPGFAASYSHYSPYHPNGLKDVIPVSLGDTLPFYRNDMGDGWQWETGMQADAYAYFNVDTQAKALQNTDFFVGGYGAVRHKNLSFIVRYFHQSSHLGDEFLLDNPAYYNGLRQKISYEQLNGIVSLDLLKRTFRLYAGAGYLTDIEPSTLGRWIFQYGAQYHGPTLWHTTNTVWSPVAGIDIKNWSQNNYDTDISARAGLQVTNGHADSPRFQFLLEFYRGHSYYGQFFVNEIQYVGFGVHLYY